MVSLAQRLLAKMEGDDTILDHVVPWQLLLQTGWKCHPRPQKLSMRVNKLAHEGLECLPTQRVTDRSILLPCHPQWDKMASGNSFYFPRSPHDPITTAPSMNTGHTFRFHLPLPWLLTPQKQESSGIKIRHK